MIYHVYKPLPKLPQIWKYAGQYSLAGIDQMNSQGVYHVLMPEYRGDRLIRLPLPGMICPPSFDRITQEEIDMR